MQYTVNNTCGPRLRWLLDNAFLLTVADIGIITEDIPRTMDDKGAENAIRKNLLDRLLNSVKQVREKKKRGGVFAESALIVCAR